MGGPAGGTVRRGDGVGCAGPVRRRTVGTGVGSCGRRALVRLLSVWPERRFGISGLPVPMTLVPAHTNQSSRCRGQRGVARTATICLPLPLLVGRYLTVFYSVRVRGIVPSSSISFAGPSLPFLMPTNQPLKQPITAPERQKCSLSLEGWAIHVVHLIDFPDRLGYRKGGRKVNISSPAALATGTLLDRALNLAIFGFAG